LKALRQRAKISRATKAYLGIGNPLLDGRQNDPVFGGYYRDRAQLARLREECPKQPAPRDQVALRGGVTGSFATLFRGTSVDVEVLRRLSPLPETADELCQVRQLLQAPGRDVILGERATETTLKHLSETGQLADYKILHFATHGALAGQVEGAAEPGLILTPPPRGTSDAKALERDDGLLTSSEIATLHLDADWVVLSACNTAGGNGETAEALSGMARAFFFAGARALLVSHWEVDSDAAVKLTTRAFAEQATHPGIGPALAFRNSMKALITNGALEHAHPSHWAPFVVVGEGTAEEFPLLTSSVVPGAEMPSPAKPKSRSVKKTPASSWQKEIWR
jgi:CHAT domain-containing protein